MPRRIPHLAENIIKRAGLLFSTRGYDAVDMKLVASEAGTSVGNLYNYYKSKPELFLAVTTQWRKDLMNEGGKLLRGPGTPRERALALLKRFYDDIAGWQGVWQEFFKGSDEKSRVFELKARSGAKDGWLGSPEEQGLLSELESLLIGSETSESRWAQLLVMAVIQMAKRYPKDRENNWLFMEKLVDMICKEFSASF